MKVQIGKTTLQLVEGDITREETEAIVNAANSGLLGGGGVDGAIHRAGGPTIMEECRKIGRCPTGEARITSGGNLKARFVIHAVGPVYSDGSRGEAGLLASAYQNCLKTASQNGVRSVSFPSLSTGAYRYPIEEAARIALETVIGCLKEGPEIDLVRFVLFGQDAFLVYKKVLQDLARTG